MNAQVLMYVVTALVLVSWFYFLIRRRWNLPSAHGPQFFLGIDVAPGFQGEPALQWTRRYRTWLGVEHVLVLLAAVVLIATGLWRWLPGWAGGIAVVDIVATRVFLGWARRSIPVADRAEAAPTVALSLEVRRLGDYLSWVSESLLAATLVVSWVLLLTRGDGTWRWQIAAVWTYLAVASTLWKVNAVRSGAPLPADRTLEHQQWLNARRRHLVRVLNCFSWLVVLLVAGYAALHNTATNGAAPWLRWAMVSLAGAIWLVLVGVTARGQNRLASLSGNLRPVESWRGFSASGREYLMPGGLYGVGLAVGLVLLIALGLLAS